jgi:hypothetical protein
MDFKMPTRSRNPSLEKTAIKLALEQDFLQDRMVNIARTAANAMEWTFPYLTDEAKVAVTLDTVYFFTTDDMNDSFIDACKEFSTRILMHKSQRCKLLQSWANNLVELARHFGAYASAKALWNLSAQR